MPRLIPISYRGHPYPMGISPALDELPGHFDRKAFLTKRPYCLHTEYSAGPRQWNSPLLRGLDEIITAQRKGIPELWPNHRWGEQFAEFIIRLVGDNQDPTLIESNFVHAIPAFCCIIVSLFGVSCPPEDAEVTRSYSLSYLL